MKKSSKADSITIPKKVIPGIAPAIGIIAVLIAKDKVGEIVLFMIGIGLGVYIGKGLMKGKK